MPRIGKKLIRLTIWNFLTIIKALNSQVAGSYPPEKNLNFIVHAQLRMLISDIIYAPCQQRSLRKKNKHLCSVWAFPNLIPRHSSLREGPSKSKLLSDLGLRLTCHRSDIGKKELAFIRLNFSGQQIRRKSSEQGISKKWEQSSRKGERDQIARRIH